MEAQIIHEPAVNPFKPQGSGVDADYEYHQVKTEQQLWEAKARGWEEAPSQEGIHFGVPPVGPHVRIMHRLRDEAAQRHQAKVARSHARSDMLGRRRPRKPGPGCAGESVSTSRTRVSLPGGVIKK